MIETSKCVYCPFIDKLTGHCKITACAYRQFSNPLPSNKIVGEVKVEEFKKPCEHDYIRIVSGHFVVTENCACDYWWCKKCGKLKATKTYDGSFVQEWEPKDE